MSTRLSGITKETLPWPIEPPPNSPWRDYRIPGYDLSIRDLFRNIAEGGYFDLGGSLAVASQGHFGTGVSTDLNVTFLNPGGKVGDVLKAVAECDKRREADNGKVGKNLAYTTICFTNSQGKIAARGSHTKQATFCHYNISCQVTEVI
ncbi:hypothetical protein Golomagni_05306 [Golovinomyces magnicellulatus]|nr:hypothetical protein Golomagni_05306 [Golovinomyces magnicellulatus]